MPHYFFNFDNGSPGFVDLVGRDLPDDEAAKTVARKLAADLATDQALEGKSLTYRWIEVIDEAQRAVARLPVAAVLKEPNRTT